ncbi:uncharacterized protein LOC110818358 isoform X1 [Carica papaya]|uniref:uncharacterized protein LOC110818358 isoform X1 n=1 Tax=Carica papaya TaxID=3649 RepID=UPI000B8CA541|nr:uncharacterized protein LOC110818358 isoform X1 [Carica papaya]
MSEAPKLYTNKPKKATVRLKQFQEQHKGKDFTPPSSSTPSSSSSASAAAASYAMGSQSAPPPPPQPPKESFARRYKFLWPLLLTVNLAVGAYLFMRTRKNDGSTVEEDSVPAATTSTDISNPVTEKPSPPSSSLKPVKLHKPIPENQQRELFKWMLEEKRKVKPKNSEEKKRIDEEKAILKQFIRAEVIPTF